MVVLISSFAFSAFVGVALANHWHDYACYGACSVWHGMVHGSSTTDGSYFARTEAHRSISHGFWTDCKAYANNGLTLIGSNQTTYGDLCQVWSGGTGFWNEQTGSGWNWSRDAGDSIPAHSHAAH
jgi:hypothetical protein